MMMVMDGDDGALSEACGMILGKMQEQSTPSCQGKRPRQPPVLVQNGRLVYSGSQVVLSNAALIRQTLML